MIRVGKHIVQDLMRNRFILAYTGLLLILSGSMFSLDSDPGKATLSLLNLVLMVVPLVSIIFTTIYFFNSYEFIELLLSQPINRKVVFFSEVVSLSAALGMAFMIGVGLPLLILNPGGATGYMILAGLLLTWVFVSLAFVAALSTRDKAKGIGLTLLFWFYFELIYDGFLLYIIYAFSDYPLEKVTLTLTALNPVDLARILILLKLDISALMGYTGAFYQNFFGSSQGVLVVGVLLILWAVAPVLLAWRKFSRKDI